MHQQMICRICAYTTPPCNPIRNCVLVYADQHHQPLASPLLPQLAPMLDLSMRPRFFTPCATSVKSAAAQGLGPVSESKASSPAGSARSSKSPAQRPLFQDTPDVASSAHGAAAYAWAVDQGAPEELLVEPMSTALKDSQQEEDPGRCS